jgi:hypothetical protein
MENKLVGKLKLRFINMGRKFWHTGYKIIIVPLIKVSFTFFGGTVGIWGSYIVLNVLFSKVFPNAKWPGIDGFIHHGEILIISFAILAEALYYSTRDLKINIFNVFSSVLLTASIFLYARVIALKSSLPDSPEHDSIIFTYSPICFFASIILFYIIIVREKLHEESGNIPLVRDNDLQNLEDRFNKG